MRTKMKWVSMLTIAIMLLTLVLSGCGAQNAEEQQPNDTDQKPSIATAVTFNPPMMDWDPSIISSSENRIVQNIYETLLRYDANTNTLEPILAESYSKSEDGLIWTFKLRQGIKFHDGTDFNADAVKYSIDRTMEMEKGTSYIWGNVNEIKVVDPYTVEFTLSKPDSLDYIAASNTGSFIMSPTSAEQGTEWFGKGNECGTGPYKIQSQVPGNEVILTKFDEYWGGWEGEHFDKIAFKYVGENASRRQMIESGEADIVDNLMPEDIDALKENADVNVVESTSYTNSIAFVNTMKPPLDNKLVRQALLYAFPYEDVIKYVNKGYATLSTGTIAKPLWGSASESPYKYDLEKAKELLKEAGLPDGGFKVVYSYASGQEGRQKTAELYKSELAKIGVELDLRPATFDSIWELAKSPNPKDRQDIIVIRSWPDILNPASLLIPYYHSEESITWNLSYFYSDNLDKMLEDANVMSAIDAEKAADMYRDVEKLVSDEALTIYQGDEKSIYIVNKTFKGFVPNPAYQGVVFFYETYRE